MTMHPLVIMCAASLVLLTGCASPTIIRGPIAVKPLILEPAKDGKILILVSGNATVKGQLWVQEDASLATLENLVGVRPEWASRSIEIIRQTQTGTERIKVRLSKMTRKEKEKFTLSHGDRVCFVWDGCFGYVPETHLGMRA